MGYRTNNLYIFTISKDDNHQDKDLIEMWWELDNDFDENSENWGGMDDDLLKLGYESQAERDIKEKDWIEEDFDDISKIETVLEWIEEGHGSFSTQFKSIISESDEGYSVAVSYLT